MKSFIALGAAILALAVSVGSTIAPTVADKVSSPACEAPQVLATNEDYIGIDAAVGEWVVQWFKNRAKDPSKPMPGVGYQIFGAAYAGKSDAKDANGKSVKLDGVTTIEVIVAFADGYTLGDSASLVVQRECAGGEWEVVATDNPLDPKAKKGK